MTLLDDRGRLFGRLNLIDAAAALLVLLLVPLGYGAYVLFRQPAPVITTVTPVSIKGAKGELLDIDGVHLRPFLRAYLGTTAVDYLFASPDRARLSLPELPPGSYEVILYDEAKEVARGSAITVVAPVKPPAPDPVKVVALLVGTFNGLTPERAKTLRPGVRLAVGADRKTPLVEWLEVVDVQAPRPATAVLRENVAIGIELRGRQQVVAAVRVHGVLAGRDLTFLETRVIQGAELNAPVFIDAAPADAAPTDDKGTGQSRPFTFTVQRLYPERMPTVDLQMRFVTRPDIVAAMKRDQVAPSARAGVLASLGPQLLSADVTEDLLGQTKADLREGRIVVVAAAVRVRAYRANDGWFYENRPLRAGVELAIEAANWSVTGTVLSIRPRDDVAAP